MIELNDEPDTVTDITEQQSKRRRKSKNNLDSIIEKITEISNKKMDMLMKIKENDVSPDIRDFFISISRTVEKFSSYDQAIAKKKNFRPGH